MRRAAGRSLLAGLVIALLAAGCVGPSPPEPVDPAAHRARVEQWRQTRQEQLAEPDGWLSLAGLYWLEEGTSRLGSDPEAELYYAGGDAPAMLGSFEVADGTVTFSAADGVQVTVDDAPVSSIVARGPDPDQEAPAMAWGALRWYVIKRGGRLALRLRDASNPVLVAFTGVENFSIAPEWRVDGRFEPYDPPRVIKVPNILGTLNDTDSIGAVVFEVDGETHRLDVWMDSEDDVEYFTAFADTTNADTTYGGGRFLRMDFADEHGHVVIDFNRAYNPPCVFTTFATCPLPPMQNRLELRVEAGERDFKSAL